MKRLQSLLGQLLREDARGLLLTSGQRPRLKTTAGMEPLGEAALDEDTVLQILFAAGGSRHLEALGSKPVTWSVRVEKIGPVRITATKRGEVPEAELTPPLLEAPPKSARSQSKRPAKQSIPAPANAAGGARRPSKRPSQPAVRREPIITVRPLAPAPSSLRSQSAAKAKGASPSPPSLRDAPPITANGFTLSRPLSRLLAEARSSGASDLHIVAGRPPLFRVGGDLTPRGEAVDAAAVEAMILESVPKRLTDVLARSGSADYSLDLSRLGRFRVNLSRQRTGLKACFRLIATEIPTIESLELPPEIAQATQHHQGLIVITGPTGHGKTTTLAALVDLFNRETTHHIITVEDPIEFVHPRKRALVSQREVGAHTKSFGAALKAALREDPDIIVVGELRDQETVRMALSASETGHLVMGTMNTPSAARTIERLIDMFPPGDQAQVRVTLAGGLRLVVGQRLIPSPDRKRRHAAVELLPGSIALWNLIRDSKTYQIPSLQQRGRGVGILRIDDSLAELVRSGKVTMADASRVTASPDELKAQAIAAPLAPPLAAPPATAPKAEAVAPLGSPAGEEAAPGLFERAGAFFTRKGR